VCNREPRDDNRSMAILLFLLTLTSAAPPPRCKPQFAPLERRVRRLAHLTWTSGGKKRQATGVEHDGLDGGGTATRSSRCGLVVRDRPKDSPDQQEEEVTVESVPAVSLAVRCVAGSCGQDPQRRRDEPRSAAPRAAGDHARKAAVPVTPRGEDPYLADAKVMLAHSRRTQVL
jgi:hypothetical protein